MQSAIWGKLIKRLTEILPETVATMNSPASEDKVKSLEEKMDVSLPETFKNYLLTHNGQDHQHYQFPLIAYHCFLSIDEIEKDWQRQMDFYADEPRIKDLEENMVQPVVWDRNWIPFTDFEGTDRLVIDLNPGKNGTVGQILFLYPGVDLSAANVVVAPSFESFSEQLLEHLEHGFYEVNEEVNIIDFLDEWI